MFGQAAAVVPAGAVLIRPAPGAPASALAEQARLHGTAAFARGEDALQEVLLPPSPQLDDLLAALLCSGAPEWNPEGQGAWLEALCDYAAQVREGLLPGSLKPEASLCGLYAAMGELYRERPHVLIERARLLLMVAAQAVQAGRSLLHEDLFADDHRFGRDRAYLDADRRRFRRDRRAGSELQGQLEGHAVHILCLVNPTSILFRLFAYREPEAPGGEGYDLVLTFRSARSADHLHASLFADPQRRLPLREVMCSLAGTFDELERACGSRAPAWYDGAHHGYQRLASPREGSQLARKIIIAQIARALRARPREEGSRGQRVVVLAGALLSCLLVRSSVHLPPEPVVARSDWQAHRLPTAAPASEEERLRLLRRTPRAWALLVAVNHYAPRSQGGLGGLRTPWRDACVLRELLQRRFGYEAENIFLLSDLACQGGVQGPPTRQQILRTLESLPVRSDDTFLFYYAGHGAIEEEPGGRYGYLQPGGWEEQSHLSREDRGLRMRVLAELLRDKVAARHQLLLVDACHSGEAAVVRGEDGISLGRLQAPLRTAWQERPVYSVITAADRNDLALEERLIDSAHPHSLFVRAMLEALSYRAGPGGCRLRADQDPPGSPDGLVTDGELFKFVARRVPELRASISTPWMPAEAQRQEPQWNPWAAAPRGNLAARQIGEFLFIPKDVPPQDCNADREPEPDSCRTLPCAP